MEKIKRWEKIFPIIQNISDMTIFESGWENDSYGNTFGPCTREYYLLHFITEGKGFYIIDGKEYEIEKGQVFLIPPNISTKYYADNDNPWKYLWIGFNSTQCKDLMEACGFLDGVYVLPFNKMHIIKHAKKELSALMGDQIAYDYFVHGCLYEIFGYLFHASHNSKSLIKNDTYIQKAKKFIENNFHLLNDWWHVDILPQFLKEFDLDFAYAKACEYIKHENPFVRRWGYVLFMPTLVKKADAFDKIISLSLLRQALQGDSVLLRSIHSTHKQRDLLS